MKAQVEESGKEKENQEERSVFKNPSLTEKQQVLNYFIDVDSQTMPS